MKSPQYSIKTFFTFLFAIVAIVPLSIAVLSSILFLKPIEDKQYFDHFHTVALLISNRIKTALKEGEREIYELVPRIRDSVDDTELLDQHINTFLQQYTHFQTVYITDNNGLLSNIGLPKDIQYLESNFVGLDVSQRQFYQDTVSTGQPHWSASFLSAISGRLATAYTYPIGNRVIVGELALNLLPGVLSEINEKTNVQVMVLDQSNQLVAHANPSLSNQQINLSNIELVSSNQNSQKIDKFVFNQQESFGIFIPINNTPWSILVSQPIEVEYAFYRPFLIVATVTIIGSLLLALLLAYLFGINLTQKFMLYTTAIRNLATGLKQGNLKQHQTPIKELNNLSKNIELTAKIITDREEELASINVDLESRVMDRTDDLQLANSELKGTLSQLRKTQEELIHSEKMAALGSLVAGVAHELNTPIGVAVTAVTTQMEYQQLLSKGFNENSLTKSYLSSYIDDIKMSNDIILSNLSKSAELIKSFKQVAVDQTSDQKRSFSLTTTINDIVLALNPLLKKSPHKLSLHLEDNIELLSYPGALGQVITNLINNALIHGLDPKQPGTIHIESSLNDNNTVNITISDNGIGISTDLQGRVFEPFFTTKRGNGGSGLGLNIVHNLVTTILQGQINILSAAGKGAQFNITIPLKVLDLKNVLE